MRIPRPRLPQTILSPRPSSRYITTTKPPQSSSTRPKRPPPFPTVPHCPPSTCLCAPTPSFADLDTTTPLNGAITAYHEQILVCTGKTDWSSRIEEEDNGENLAAYLKNTFLGRGGEMNDPFYNVSILNASFESAEGGADVYLLPSFKYVPMRKGVDEDVRNMLKGWVLPETLSPMYEKTPEMKPEDPGRLLRDEAARYKLQGVRDVGEVMVLICGHGGRDERCGVFGPVLRAEFEEKLGTVGGFTVEKSIGEPQEGAKTARVGLISHIGGHKYAGNVIIYIPPGMKLENGEDHPLAGLGIWYGRVEPKHVEGIVKETLGRGVVIEEFYRGAIDRERRIVRLDDGGLKRVRGSK